MNTNFIIQKRGGDIISPETIFSPGKPALFIGAHPDDIPMYACSMVQLALLHGMSVWTITASDGGMGYVNKPDAVGLADRRQEQDKAALTGLGISAEQIQILGYPDGSLYRHVGRWWLEEPTEKREGEAYGLEGELTGMIRIIQPSLVFTHSFDGEAHGDHRALSPCVMMAIRHAVGGTWKDEGGDNLPEYPKLLHWMPYSGLPEGKVPDLLVRMPEEAAKAKAAALACYSGQDQVAHLMALLASAPYEYFCEVRLKGLDPKEYLEHFPLPKK